MILGTSFKKFTCFLSLATTLTASLAVPAAEQTIPIYRQAEQTTDARVSDLIARMTTDEKIAQITTLWNQKRDILDDTGQLMADKVRELYPHGIGQVARPNEGIKGPSTSSEPSRNARETVELINSLQTYAIERTRLGIPILFHEESLHGYMARGATSFPQAIALASTWDRALLTNVFSVAAREMRARGAHLALSPVVDVARDPRWGRTEETYGEDPYLVSELGVAAIRGFQGDTLPLGPDKVFVTLKHMTGHGQPESGTNVGPANFSERLLREVFFPPFEEAIKRTNVRSVMASYNEIDGVPSHANEWLLKDVLRGEWGFDGVVVSDYNGIEQLWEVHSVEPDLKHAAVRALNAGVDVELPDGYAYLELKEALKEGLISQSTLDRATRGILELKFDAGLFEKPYADADYAEKITDNTQARELAEEAARKSIILLKNDGVLPIDLSSVKRIAVIGPNADAERLGGYSETPNRVITVLEGLRAQVGDEIKLDYHEGIELTSKGSYYEDEVVLGDPQSNQKSIAEAQKVAQAADVIVLVIGGSEATAREAWSESHPGDRTDIELVGDQKALADAMFSLGKPVVTVLINGRPLGVDGVAKKSNALIEGWYLGQEGGTAMADVLFGKANPGGKLPVTIPYNVGQLPMVYNHKPSALRNYLFDTNKPLFPFGYGLSYTTFKISPPTLSKKTILTHGTVIVSTTVTNTGDRKGDEVVQLYVRDLISSVTRPVKELKGFERITLDPGESKKLNFELGPNELRFWNSKMQRVVEPGEFEIQLGSSSNAVSSVTLTVE